MGSSAVLDTVPAGDPKIVDGPSSSGPNAKNAVKRSKAKETSGQKRKLQSSPPNSGEHDDAPRRPRRAAACTDFKEKSFKISEESFFIETKEEKVAEEEILAVRLTCEQNDEIRPNRRLTDFILHDSNGAPQPLEVLEVDDMFITGLILPFEGSSDKEKERGVRCDGFGRIETWNISGYEDGSPVIWLSTDIADYDCRRPANSYRKFYDHFLEKARASVEVYKKLSKSAGGNPDLCLDELLAGVVRSMSGSKIFSSGTSIKDFVISQGGFIYSQLIGLDETLKYNDRSFAELPALAALRNESINRENFLQAEAKPTNGSLKIGKTFEGMEASDEDEDAKLAKLLQEEEYWKSMKQRRKNVSAPASNKVYIKINEDEIANDYPLPSFYKNTAEEMDELIVFDNDFDMCETHELPRSMLHNWALYNSDSRLISLELLPMKPCADIDVTIYGSGIMTADDGSGFCLDSDAGGSTCGKSQTMNIDGIPIFLSEIKEWMIEFGSSMVFVSIRTDNAWYRLGKPSKQYVQWYEPVLKTARVAISIIALLKEQSRVARLSFVDVVKKFSEFKKDHQAYISSDIAAVERYIVVHGQIILQLFAEFPDEKIRRCPFVISLTSKMEERHHTKWIVKKKKLVLRNGANMNPRAGLQPIHSRKAMQATTTRLINRIWGEYYSNYSPEDATVADGVAKEEDEVEEQDEIEEDDAQDSVLMLEGVPKSQSTLKKVISSSERRGVNWEGEPVGKTCAGEPIFKKAVFCANMVSVGNCVLLETDESDLPAIYYVEYMFERADGCKVFHGRMMQRGSQTVLGNAANERELFMTNECTNLNLEDVKDTVVVEIRSRPWGHQHRKENADIDKQDRARAEERKKKGLPLEYYCKSLYWPEKGAFYSLLVNNVGLGSGVCNSCILKQEEESREMFTCNSSRAGFIFNGIEYSVDDFVYVSPYEFHMETTENETFKSGRNVGLRAYVVCQILEIVTPNKPSEAKMESTHVRVRRFYRPEDISEEKAYSSDVREVYYSEESHLLSVVTIKGKCEVRKRSDLPACNASAVSEHIFFCECMYDSLKGSIKQLPANIKLRFSTGNSDGDIALKKKKGKGKEVENDLQVEEGQDTPREIKLTTLDIFAGCGGLSEGLQQSGVSSTKWAIEYEEPAGDAFKLNHPGSLVFVANCNVILRAIMERSGDLDDCISTSEAAELAAKLDENDRSGLPLPGQVDFINGGPPCQGFSGMNRFNYTSWSKVQCEMVLAFLSFAEYFRPRYFLLENVRNFVSFNKGQTFRLTLASLLEMGYQVRFGILEAGAFGISQSRKRVFIWAASPDDILPDWPEPMHVFAAPELRISLSEGLHYSAVCSTTNGAPFRAITVRDAIGDLPAVCNGASKATMEYQSEPVSWFQRNVRGEKAVLTDHMSKEMNELNFIRCQKIPRRPGADWRDLPDEKIKLSTGQMVDLIPWCLPNTARRHNHWKGLFGRLDWEGNFPTSITDPQPMGKVGMCFHPEQDRIITVRECARSQGFPDSYQFSGNLQHKYRQIGNAVPPPLAYALGRKLKEALESKRSQQQQQLGVGV